jgi:putative hydrolase of the HAD superfamily
VLTEGRTKALLLDYGCVLSRPQPADDLRRLEALVPDVRPSDLWRRYWDLRLRYDEGMPDEAYWSAVLDRPATAAELRALVAADAASWLHLEPAMTGALPALRATGVRLGLLSNAPTSLARAVAAESWTAPFAALVFSAEIGAAKPHPEAYAAAAAALDVPAGEVLFVDDREENVAGAEAAGMRGLHHRNPADTLARLTEMVGVGLS